MASTSLVLDWDLLKQKLELPLDLDRLHEEMLSLVPATEPLLCCCTLLNPSLALHEHLDHCEIKLLDVHVTVSAVQDVPLASAAVEDKSVDRRRKHRESMARLRRGWRTSIAVLQRQEQHLQQVLRHTIAVNTVSTLDQSPIHSLEPLAVLRRAYCDLVAEQLQLQDELTSLEAARAHHDKYARLLERELDRVRLFSATQTED